MEALNIPLAYFVRTQAELDSLVTLLNSSGSDYTDLHTRFNEIKSRVDAGKPAIQEVNDLYLEL